MSRKKTDFLLESITIEDIAAEGKGVARVDGMVLFVDSAIPGDIVDVHVFKKKHNYMEGRIERMVKPSDRRLEPFCEHFGVCGGCKWQALPYEDQLEAKTRQVRDQLVRIGHLEVPGIRPCLPSDHTTFYRNKLEFTFSSRRWFLDGENPDLLPPEQRCGLGFHVGKFFDKVLDIRQCHLQREPSNAIRNFVREWALDHGLEFYDLRANSGYIRSLFIRTSDSTGEVMVILTFAHDDDPAVRIALLDALSERFPEISSLYYVINRKFNDSISDQECVLYRGSEAIYEIMEGLRFKIGPKSFYQTNSLQAYKLYSVARDFAALSGSEVVYDLYTGTGTIAQFVSSKASKVIGIEYIEEAVEAAREGAKANGISNCSFYAGDMKDVLTDAFIAAHGAPHVMILDPPRAGIHPDVARVIMRAAPKRMVYVSCNPASQARDLAIFSEKYSITAVQPVDMFPHTMHVENVCSLELMK